MTTELLLVEPGHTAFALCHGRALIQLRSGAMTHGVLDACERLVFPRLRQASGPVGALIVLNGDARVPDTDVRARQQRVVGSLLDETGAFMVSVVEGTTIQATSLRTVTRVLVLGKPRLVHRPDATSAAAWLGTSLGLPADELVDAVATVRAALAAAPT